MTLLTVLLFDVLLLVVLGRVAYNWYIWLLEGLLDYFQVAAHRGQERTRRGSGHRSLAYSGNLYRSGGGVQGATTEGSDWESDGPDLSFPHRHLLRQRVQQRLLALERRPPPATTSSTRRLSHWIAVTEPARQIELPVHLEVIGVARALKLELAETRPVSWIAKMANSAAGAVGLGDGQLSDSWAVDDLSPFGRLPQELINAIVLLSAAPSLSPDDPPSSPINVLLLSKQYYRMLLPRLYFSVCLNTAFSFRSFRLTMALHNPALGKLVHHLQIGSSQHDTSGYIPGRLAEPGPLAVGIEQILLATPNLEHFSIDLFSLAALHTGTAARLEKGCQPRSLTTELTVIPYLSLPTFEDLRDLELLVFGLDRQTAMELRIALPRLERLTLRFVSRRRVAARGKSTTPALRTTAQDGSSISDEDGYENYATSQDVDDFVDAVDALRSWPDGDTSSGRRLDSLTVFTWPGALATLRTAATDARLLDPGGRVSELAEVTDKVMPARGTDEGDGEPDDKGEPASCPLYVGIDRGYLLGPRRGSHVLWRKDKARLAWS